MKKALAAIMAVSIAALGLAGCTGKYMGEWATKKVKINDRSYSSSEFKDHFDYDAEDFLALELEKDGTGTITLYDGKYESDIEWEIDDDEITIDVEDDDLGIKDMEGKLKDDKIVLSYKTEIEDEYWDYTDRYSYSVTLVKDD
ncbi:MAG: hypothetical protein IJ746_03095 [Ruminococcus sp.]|nr:hypothetical protein [Ruminococcus sp.]